MNYRYVTCDVFTDTRFGGNPLAVLPDAEGLSDLQMQQIAREFNYSETTFVFPPETGSELDKTIVILLSTHSYPLNPSSRSSACDCSSVKALDFSLSATRRSSSSKSARTDL